MKLDFSQKYAVRPLTAGDVDKILALCAENEQFYRYHPPLATRESVLEDMTALPPGKCAALIGELLDELRREKFCKVRLAVDRGNPQSKAFWEKNGFALTGEEFPNGDSAYLPMERAL